MNEQLTLAQMMLWSLVQAMVHLMAYCLASHLVRMMMGFIIVLQCVDLLAILA